MNLKGGYKIIDLSSISLVGSEDGDYIAITDKKILEQLLSLKDYLDDSKELKPIYLRAKTSGKETVMGSLAKKIGEDILYIDAKLVSSKVQIKVVFERDAETQEISIDEAGYLYVSDADSVMADVAKAESGTIVDALGLDADGALVKGAVSGGTKLYKHIIKLTRAENPDIYLEIISKQASGYSSLLSIFTASNNNIPLNMFYIGSSLNLYSILETIIGEYGAGNGTFYYLKKTDGTIATISVNGYSIDTDTFTEL